MLLRVPVAMNELVSDSKGTDEALPVLGSKNFEMVFVSAAKLTGGFLSRPAELFSFRGGTP